MAQEFTLESVKEFIVSRGGRVKNSELVTHFKHFLNDVHQKELMREKFKNYVNTLATIKLEQNEKVLLLKKKYAPDPNSNVQMWELRAHSEPPGRTIVHKDQLDSHVSSRIRSDNNLTNTHSMMSSQTSACDVASLGSTVSTSSLSSEEESNTSVVSVKDRAQHLNRMASQSEIQKTPMLNLGAAKNYTKKGHDADGDDVSSSSSNNSYTPLNALEKDWLVKSSSSDYQMMHQLLSKHPELVTVRDFMSTALHWAAKNGKPEVVKMLMGKPGINVNQKTGYTALHLAAIYEHNDLMELLIKTCNADPNIRDYSGKKAKQYLSNSATSNIPRKSHPAFTESLDSSFTTSINLRSAVFGEPIALRNKIKSVSKPTDFRRIKSELISFPSNFRHVQSANFSDTIGGFGGGSLRASVKVGQDSNLETITDENPYSSDL